MLLEGLWLFYRPVIYKLCLIIKQTYELYSRWQKSSEMRATVQVCEKIRPFWGKSESVSERAWNSKKKLVHSSIPWAWIP